MELVGYAAFATNVAGNLMLAWQTIWGWVVRLVSIMLWFAYAYSEADAPLIANACTFFCLNLFGLWKWTRERRKKTCRVCGMPTVSREICVNHDC